MTEADANTSLSIDDFISKIELSIVMPVFNGGVLLLDSVRSILSQTYFATADAPDWELLLVDDGSTDVATLEALRLAVTLSSNIRLLANNRSQGAAGARNTGVFAARGRWVGFLDSDDLLYVDFYEKRHAAFAALQTARWRAAHFHVGDGDAKPLQVPLKQRSPCLYRVIADDYDAGQVSVLKCPVDILLRCGCMQVMSVQIESELLRSVGGFDETLTCAEDYDLWLRLAAFQELHIAPVDAGIYRIRPGSLTKSDRPMYYQEDRMLLGLRRRPEFERFEKQIDVRLASIYSSFCFHFRKGRDFRLAAQYACLLLQLSPFAKEGWKHLAAASLRR